MEKNKMATEILTANEIEIKQAMGVLGLDNRVDDLLDEIELDRELKISLEQADRGELISAEELRKEMKEKFANGK
jgi:F0F1-type ATP synthase delta subunit